MMQSYGPSALVSMDLLVAPELLRRVLQRARLQATSLQHEVAVALHDRRRAIQGLADSNLGDHPDGEVVCIREHGALDQERGRCEAVSEADKMAGCDLCCKTHAAHSRSVRAVGRGR